MSLLVIEVTYLEGRDGELVVKELAGAASHCNKMSSYVFKRPYNWEDVPIFNTRINETLDHGGNWNDSDVFYSELETVLHREASSDATIYCFEP
jgi:hypothetical protein